MINYLRKLLRPEIFQGSGKKDTYFEGWYYKHVANGGSTVFSFIPGISIDKYGNSHAFVQYINGKTGQSYFFSFPGSTFDYSKKEFEIEIGLNRFSRDKLYIEIDENPGISAEIIYKNHTLPKRSLLSPGIMGWYSYIPFMECYHGLVSLDNDIEGFIQIGDKITDLTGGKGYIEKDWGVSFPKSWLWLQCNTFDNDKTSFFFSIAHIPWLGKYFIGYISVLLFEGKVHKFATYNNAKLDHISLSENKAELRLRNKDIELNVNALRKNGAILQAPTAGKMDRRISESIDADISLEIKTSSGTTFLNGINTGMELVGDISELTNKQKIK